MSATHRHHVPSRSRRRRILTTAGLAGAVLVSGAALAARVQGEDSCPQGRTLLQVAASPDLAPVLASVAADLAADQQACVTATVTGLAPVEVVNRLAGGEIRPPDVWVPDSSLWLTRAATDRVADAKDAPSVASSPLVLAMNADAATRLTGGARTPEIADVVEASNAGRPLTLQLSEQRLSPARVGTILALQAAVADRRDARGALAGLLQSARVNDSAMPDQLASLGNDAQVAVPAPEQAVWAANSGDGPAAVVAVYPEGSSFDYPYAVLTRDAATRSAAAALLDALTSSRGQAALRAAGFRDVDGGAAPGLTPQRGVDPARSSVHAAPGEPSLAAAERALASVKADARLLAVIDVSGSMDRVVPGAGGASRLDLATAAGSRGLGLYPDSTEVGFWIFSTDLTPTSDHREVLPITSLGSTADGTSGREALTTALAEVTVEPGATGLYDTALAAVRTVRRDWTPGRVNAVVLLSDGSDTDKTGISLARLLSTLAAEADRARPVPVITIAYGPDSGAAALSKISKATHGASYTAKDPRQIRQVFLDAIGQRACRPDCAASPLG